MKASFVDLRKKSREVIQALNRKESVTVLYRGKPVAIMQPIEGQSERAACSAKDHPAFGLWSRREDANDVASHVRRLRKARFDAL